MSTKQNELDLDKLIRAWQANAADKSFAGMTLEQFKLAVKPSLDAREAVKLADEQRQEAANNRVDADKKSMMLVQLIVNSIKGDPAFGDDSALYEACGYVRRSERKSGLSRKKAVNPPAQKAA